MAMQVKRYEASSLREAFQQIKVELGSDAVIVHSQPIRSGGWWRFLRPARFEVIAAVDRESTPVASRVERALPIEERKMLLEMKQGLADLRTQVGELSKQARSSAPMWSTPSLSKVYQHLINQEVEPDLAKALTESVAECLRPEEVSDAAALRAYAGQALKKWIKVSGPLRLVAGKPSVVMLVGPTGVGKTTTVAKLAANFALEEKGKVALITTDTFRVAAVPQLQTYADIIGVPLDIAYTPAELSGLIKRHCDKSLILVDTPGRSQLNEERLIELKAFVDTVPNGSVLLTLDASTKYADLLNTVKAFERMSPTGLLVTKLDETSSFGSLTSLAHRTGKPFTYFTTGQNVPQDIELASVGQIARLLLGGDWR